MGIVTLGALSKSVIIHAGLSASYKHLVIQQGNMSLKTDGWMNE